MDECFRQVKSVLHAMNHRLRTLTSSLLLLVAAILITACKWDLNPAASSKANPGARLQLEALLPELPEAINIDEKYSQVGLFFGENGKTILLNYKEEASRSDHELVVRISSTNSQYNGMRIVVQRGNDYAMIQHEKITEGLKIIYSR